MTPEWQEAFRYAVGLADKEGLEFSIASSPSWSETGGPWVPPRDGLKKVVWSDTVVIGGKPCQCRLAMPPATTGPLQTLRWIDDVALMGDAAKEPPKCYADAAVLAVPAKGEDQARSLSESGTGDTEVFVDQGSDFRRTRISPTP